LALLVEQELGHNPSNSALYAFTNRQRNNIKCVMWPVCQPKHESADFEITYKSGGVGERNAKANYDS
jgi:hypothetical protein